MLWNPGKIHWQNDALMWSEILNFVLAHAAMVWFAWRLTKTQFLFSWQAFIQNNRAIFAVFFLHACFIILQWNKFLIGADEFDQALRAHWKAPLLTAVEQLQQPLTYSVGRFIESLWGINDIIIRLPFALAAWLSTLFLYIALQRLNVRKNLAALISLAFACSYHLDRFAHEGRPQAFAFLTGLGFLIYFIFRRDSDEIGFLPTAKSQTDFFFVSYFFLISIGLQPVLLLALLYIIVLILAKNRRQIFSADFIPIFCACSFAILNLYLFLGFGPPRIKQSFLLSLKWFVEVKAREIHWFSIFFTPPTWVCLLVLASACYIWRRPFPRAAKNYIWVFASLTILFPPFFFVSYELFVNYPFAARYCILSILPLWLCLGCLSEFFLNQYQSRSLIWAIIALILLAASILEPRQSQDRDVVERQDVRSMQKDFQMRLGPGDWVVSIAAQQFNYDDAFEDILFIDEMHSVKPLYKAIFTLLEYDEALAKGLRPKRLVFFFYDPPEILDGFRNRLSELPNVTLFAQEYGYLAYEIHFKNEPKLDEKLIRTLDDYYMSMNEETAFQIPLLRLSNAILAANEDDWIRYRTEARKLLPQRLRNITRTFDGLIAKGIL